MQKKEMPVFVLSTVHEVDFTVKRSDKSSVGTFGMFDGSTQRPVAHLLVVDRDEALTWERARDLGIGRGDLASIADKKMGDIIAVFLPKLNLREAAWRIEINSDHAASRKTVHAHIVVGHKDLFGENGPIRRSVDPILKPEALAELILKRLQLWVDGLRNIIRAYLATIR